MPRNGSGVYSLPAVYDVSVGDTIQPEQLETPLEDIESDLNAARPVVAGGTGATTAAAARSNLGVQGAIRANDTSGSSNAYTVSTEEGLDSLTDGDFVLIVANHSNTGSATLNVDSLGAKNVQKVSSGGLTDVESGDIVSGNHYALTYDASVGSGTWVVHNPTIVEGLSGKVSDTGDTMTGNLIIDPGSYPKGVLLDTGSDQGFVGLRSGLGLLLEGSTNSNFVRVEGPGGASNVSAFTVFKGGARHEVYSRVDIASQATAEAGTDNDDVMTALRVAQAIAALNPLKIVAKITSLGGSPSVTATHNQQGTLSAVRNGQGDYTFSWTTSLTNPSVQLTARETGATPRKAIAAIHTTGGVGGTSVRILVVDDTGSVSDPTELHVTVYGT